MKVYYKDYDVKVPFDCLWYHYTRMIESLLVTRNKPDWRYNSMDSFYADGYDYGHNEYPEKGMPKGFKKW